MTQLECWKQIVQGKTLFNQKSNIYVKFHSEVLVFRKKTKVWKLSGCAFLDSKDWVVVDWEME